MKIGQILFLAVFGFFIVPRSVYAQESDIEKAAQNPIASMISLPFQDNINFGVGPDNRISNTLNIRPVVPVSLGTKLNVIVRTIIPVIKSAHIQWRWI